MKRPLLTKLRINRHYSLVKLFSPRKLPRRTRTLGAIRDTPNPGRAGFDFANHRGSMFYEEMVGPTELEVAVGTSVTGRPPHGSVRAHSSAYGSCLGCMASKRAPGSGCRIRGLGSRGAMVAINQVAKFNQVG